MEEGFRVNYRKTRIMRRSVRQLLVGVVVNDRPNIRRCDFDELKAILHNCQSDGPEAQNRRGLGDFRGHLLGRIEYVRTLNAARGSRLRAMFDAIKW